MMTCMWRPGVEHMFTTAYDYLCDVDLTCLDDSVYYPVCDLDQVSDLDNLVYDLDDRVSCPVGLVFFPSCATTMVKTQGLE